jgi:hypothetical protein
MEVVVHAAGPRGPGLEAMFVGHERYSSDISR